MAGVTFSPAILLGQNASAQSDTLKTVNRLKEVVVRGYGAERNLKAPGQSELEQQNDRQPARDVWRA